MKSLLLSTIFLFVGYALIAQGQAASNFEEKIRKENQQMIEHLLSTQGRSSQTSNKPTEIRQRVIAQSSNDQSSIIDSTIFRYSAQMGSEYNYNKYGYTYSRYYPVGYNVTNNNVVMDVMADTIIRVNDNYVDFSVAGIRQDTQLDSATDFISLFPGPINSNYTANLYDAQGKKQKSINLYKHLYNGTPTVDTIQVTTYSYNSISQLIADTSIRPIYGEYYFRRYHYNIQGLMDTMYIRYPVTFNVSTGFTAVRYNSLGFVEKFFWTLDDGSSSAVDSFSYTGISPNYTFRQSAWGLGSANADSLRIVKFMGPNGLIDSTQHFYDNAGNWEAYYSYHYYYNAFNNPDSIIGGDYIQNSHSESRFYYETYNYTSPPPVSILDAKNYRDFNVYPNPFDDRFIIECSNGENRHVHITLLNLLGQQVYKIDKILVGGINTINLPKLKKGYYILTIQDEKGNVTKKALVKH